MTTITSTQAILADARVTYARDQTQQASITGAKVNANPTESDLIANDPTLANAILAAEEATTTSSGAVGGAHGSTSGAPAGGAGGLAAVKATPDRADTSAVSAAANGVDVTA